VLIQSAAGGVGFAALQLCKIKEAQVTAVVGSHATNKKTIDEKIKLLHSLAKNAPDQILSHSDFIEFRKKNGIAQTMPFDVILDSVGAKNLKENQKLLSPTGRIIAFGASAMVKPSHRELFTILKSFLQTPIFTPFQLMMKNQGIFGLNMLKLFENKNSTLLQKSLKEILGLFELKKLKTAPLHCFKFEDIAQAHHLLESGQSAGKIILTPEFSDDLN
jgi:NADPH:quinone reductase-like Zn-dependent oxidoreductase